MVMSLFLAVQRFHGMTSRGPELVWRELLLQNACRPPLPVVPLLAST